MARLGAAITGSGYVWAWVEVVGEVSGKGSLGLFDAYGVGYRGLRVTGSGAGEDTV